MGILRMRTGLKLGLFLAAVLAAQACGTDAAGSSDAATAAGGATDGAVVAPDNGAQADGAVSTPDGAVQSTDAVGATPDGGLLLDGAVAGDAAVPGPDAAPLAPIGGECVSELDCASNFCLDSAFAQSVAQDPTVEVPGGSCTDLSCQTTPDCHEADASCIDLKASGLDIPFKACFKDCDPAVADVCRADQTCYCDPEGDITDAEGNRDHCLCLPQVLISLLGG